MRAFTAHCFERSRSAAAGRLVSRDGGAAGQAAVAEGAQAASQPPFFFASAAPLDGGAGVIVRLAAQEMDDAYAWARAALEPLHGELGGAPFRW